MCSVHPVVNDAHTFPRPLALRTDARGIRRSALSVVTGLSPEGNGLDRLIYLLGTGLSWKPIAAAFRSSTFNMLAFSLASYSSIDWVTYSSPCLSIL